MPDVCDQCDNDNGFIDSDPIGQCDCNKDTWLSQDSKKCVEYGLAVTNCLECDKKDDRSTICNRCAQGFGGDKCVACSENCLQCTSETDCTKCADTFYLKEKSCTLCSDDF